MISLILQKLKADLEIAEKATEGPAEKYLAEHDGSWHIRFPHIPRGFHGDCYGFKTFVDESDAELIVRAYTALPANTRALMRAVEALNYYYEERSPITHGLIATSSNWKSEQVVEKALADIAEILGVGK